MNLYKYIINPISKRKVMVKRQIGLFVIKKYLILTDILITSHYWDPKSPKLFDLSQIKEFKNLKIIGDITCDINGSVPTTIRSSSIFEPYYSIDRKIFKETSPYK